ncbi:DUF5107 domain-containing protein [Paenibacillus thalictri]|uniref:DUF5107 domain-containing protein n=1 Tax=Paenibacillus thalictri TaxID=2527873 RepID=A0A4Q9DMN8_9BACL|nr:DUF5107 domain-containing protein [Paenibacillus thalictri]TBL76592.1 DUF5107 domain-containing protein [Paenibacillus thalictri]
MITYGKVEPFDTFDKVTLENERLRLQILPGLGGKICSLLNKTTNREWLDRPPHRPFRMPQMGSLWEEWDRCGWDELFPSIDACRLDISGIDEDDTDADASGLSGSPHKRQTEVPIPDHGELWAVPWEYEELDPLTLKLSVNSRLLPVRLEKTIRLQDNRVHFHYSLTNRGRHALPYIWAPHPIIAATEQMTIELPATVKRIVTAYSADGRLGTRGDEHAWPTACAANGDQVELNAMPARNSGVADKFYVKPPCREGWCAVRVNDTGERFKLTYDTADLPYLGIWINGGGWNGEYHLALEPATGYLDNLHDAYRNEQCAVIGASAMSSWDMQLEIS